MACSTRSAGVKIPLRFWSLDGARLECHQKYFNTKNSKGYVSIQLLFHIEIPSTNWVFTMVKLAPKIVDRLHQVFAILVCKKCLQ